MKAINDGLGHEAGDRALVATAGVLTRVFREADVVARLGGDEFAVLASDCAAKDIERVASRVQGAVEQYNGTSGEAFRLSMSVGAAVFDPKNPVDLETLMASADAQLHEQKIKSDSSPRNRPRSGPITPGDERKVS